MSLRTHPTIPAQITRGWRLISFRSYGGTQFIVRLEHLGDTVLGLSITTLLTEMYPYLRVGPATVCNFSTAVTPLFSVLRSCQSSVLPVTFLLESPGHDGLEFESRRNVRGVDLVVGRKRHVLTDFTALSGTSCQNISVFTPPRPLLSRHRPTSKVCSTWSHLLTASLSRDAF